MIDWICRLDWQAPMDHELTNAEVRRLRKRLGDRASSDGISYHYGEGTEGYALGSAKITLRARSVTEVVGLMIPVVEDALGVTVTGIEVETVEEYEFRHLDRQNEREPLIGFAHIARLLGVSRQRARQLAQTGPGFPELKVLAVSGPLFDRDEVTAWAGTWERKPGRPRKASTS